MKPKSKPALVAAVVLHALLFILPVSAWAAAEDAQEIGVPKPVESKVNSCFDVHLSPGSDRFYTLRDGMLTQYQINPLKKLGATRGDWNVVKEIGCHMLVTDDEKKLLVVGKSQIYTFDIVTGRLLNKAGWEYKSFPDVLINNDELLVLLTRQTVPATGMIHEHDVQFEFDLDIWDINTLKLKRHITNFGKEFDFVHSLNLGPAMSKIQDRIYMRTGKSFVVLNGKTYKPELSLATRLFAVYGGKYDPKQLSVSELPLLSKDFRTLYAPSVSKVTDYLTGKQSSFDEIGRDKAFVFDQKTRDYRIVSLKDLRRDELQPWLFGGNHLSRNKNYLMSGQGSYSAQAVLRNISAGSFMFFYQYKGGEAIVVEHAVDRQLLGFQLTPGARKYLMMDKAARIPINDATFKKYHGPEVLN